MVRTMLLLSRFLKLISFLAFGLCLFTGWMFYEFYFKWHSLFGENGRYFDPVDEAIYDDSSSIWGIFFLMALFLGVAAWLVATKIKARSS
jgi:hypothetical protein